MIHSIGSDTQGEINILYKCTSILSTPQGLIHKEKLLQYIVKIKERVEEKIEDVPRIPPQWSEQLGEWLTKIRMDGVKISPQGQQQH